jgi:hypothetical protein
MLRISLFFGCASLLAVTSVFGQPSTFYFKDVYTPFNRVSGANTQFVDLDNDLDLDLILGGGINSGTAGISVYENINGIYTLRPTTLPAITFGFFAPGDYDNDGDLDIAISGSSGVSSQLSKIMRNDGGFVFTEAYSLVGLKNSHVGWFDFDNDTDLDVLMSGLTGAQSETTLLYENTGSSFIPVTGTYLPDCGSCAFEFADANGDGKTDVIFLGPTTGLFFNNGDRSFRLDSKSNLTQMYGDANWGDIDADGDLDVLLSGIGEQNKLYTQIYENRSGSLELRSDILLVGMSSGGLRGTRWFDYNNDGLLDILVTGRILTSSGILPGGHRLYTNNGNFEFSPSFEGYVSNLLLDGMSLDPGDFDNDGDLDFSFNGYYYYGTKGPYAGYFRNSIVDGTPGPNTTPLPPSAASFHETSFRDEVRLSWDAGTDAETPAIGLSYNFHVRQGATKFIVPDADLTTGFIRSHNVANGYGRNGFVKGLPEGDLQYSVQTIDGAKVGSVFSAEKTFFSFHGPEGSNVDIIDAGHVNVRWLDRSALETHYVVERSSAPSSGFTAVSTVPANSTEYTDALAFITETPYYYRITGYDDTHTSPYDSLSLLIAEPPTEFASSRVDATRIALSWKDNSAIETSYMVERKNPGESSFITAALLPPDTHTYRDSLLQEGTTYEYRIRAITKNGGLPSNPITAKTNSFPVTTDAELQATEDVILTFVADELRSHFTDEDGDVLEAIKIKTLPADGFLMQGNVYLEVNSVISASVLHEVTFHPYQNVASPVSFTVIPYDGRDYAIAEWKVTINLAQVNDFPEFGEIDNHTLAEDFAEVSIQPPAVYFFPGEDAQTITYELSPTTSALINIDFSPTTGVLRLTPVQDVSGAVEFTFTTNDGQTINNTYSRKFTVTVTPVDDPATLEIIEDIKIDRAATVEVALSAADIDSPITPSMFTGVSANQQVLKDNNITFSASGNIIVMKLVAEKTLGVSNVSVTLRNGGFQTSRLFKFEAAIVTGVEDEGEGINAFPMPFSNELQISTGSDEAVWQVIIRDAQGREILSTTMSKDISIDARHLASGLYILTMTGSDGKSLHRRIQKK